MRARRRGGMDAGKLGGWKAKKLEGLDAWRL